MSVASNDFERTNARYCGIIDAVVDGIALIDADGVVEPFSPTAGRIFGYQAKDVVGTNVAMLVPEPDATQHGPYIQRYLNGGTPQIIGIGREVLGRRRNGELFRLELSVGELIQLGPREQALRLIFDGAAIGMSTVDLHGRINALNPALLRG